MSGSKVIVHAGDIREPHVLEALRTIAPVVAVRGNMDKGKWAQGLSEFEVIEVEKKLLYIIHDIRELDLNPVAAGVSAVISGHSHRPSIRNENGVLFVNPGSAGPRRFSLPITVALIHVKAGRLEPQIIRLDNKQGFKA